MHYLYLDFSKIEDENDRIVWVEEESYEAILSIMNLVNSDTEEIIPHVGLESIYQILGNDAMDAVQSSPVWEDSKITHKNIPDNMVFGTNMVRVLMEVISEHH